MRRFAKVAPIPCLPAALRIPRLLHRWAERQNLLRRMLGRHDNVRRRVAREHAGEDASVDDKQIVGAPNLGVGIDYSRTAVAAVVGPEFVSSCRMLGYA